MKDSTDLAINTQESFFKKALEDHMKDSQQRDDILLMGIRV
jgi:hypothetical protein